MQHHHDESDTEELKLVASGSVVLKVPVRPATRGCLDQYLLFGLKRAYVDIVIKAMKLVDALNTMLS